MSLQRKRRRLRVEQLQARHLMAADFSFVPETGGSGPVFGGPVDGGTTGFPFVPSQSPFEIVFNFGSIIRLDAEAIQAFERGANQWRQHIEDPVTLFVDVDFQDLPDGILGGALSASENVPYSVLREALVNDAATEVDDSIIASLPVVDDLHFNTPAGTTVETGSLGVEIDVTRANLKALGLLTPDDPDYLLPDASLVFDIALAPAIGDFFTTDTGVNQGTNSGVDDPFPPGFEFLTLSQSVTTVSDIRSFLEETVVHELGHALGFLSSVDFIAPNGTSPVVAPTAFDLFRFAKDLRTFNPVFANDFATFSRELRPGVNSVLDFVIDDWNIQDVEYPVERGTGVSGQQASHWLDEDLAGRTIGIMDPTASPTGITNISLADLRIFDMIGWDIAAPGQSLTDPIDDPRILPQDVNSDGTVTATDALIVINTLSRSEAQTGTDVNLDGQTTALDALNVINYLASAIRVNTASGEFVELAPVDRPVDDVDDELSAVDLAFGEIGSPDVNL
ncbi:MAG: NF038122 family metalloprotease [Planctomycetota bacterium]